MEKARWRSGSSSPSWIPSVHVHARTVQTSPCSDRASNQAKKNPDLSFFFFHLFHHSFQSNAFYCEIKLFRALEACFGQLEKMKLYSSQKCFLSIDSAQNVWIWPNYSGEICFHLLYHSFQSDVFSCQIKLFRALGACFGHLEKMIL